MKGKEILPPAQYTFLLRERETREVLHTTIEDHDRGVGDGGMEKRGWRKFKFAGQAEKADLILVRMLWE